MTLCICSWLLSAPVLFFVSSDLLVSASGVVARAGEVGSAVTPIDDANDLVKLIAAAGPRPIVLNFWTESCGYCHLMMPFFKKTAEEYRERAYFRTVNIREHPKLAKAFKVEGLPNFKFVHKKKTIEGFRGFSHDGLMHYLTKAVHKADKEEIKITKEDLLEFFRQHDVEVANSPESIEMLYTQGAMDFPKMLQLLEKQYGAKPNYTGGYIPRDPTDDEAGVHGGSDNASSQPGICRKPTASHMTLEELEAELAARKALVAAEPRHPASNPCSLYRQRNPSAVERVVIIGGGPAGMSAAVYAARSALCPLVIAPPFGGQLMMKGVDVENYPGLPRANGRVMVQEMREQARSFHAGFVDDAIVAVDFSQRPFVLTTNTSGVIRTEAVILATGSDSKWLGVPGEYELRGHGVSSCAACDGYLHRDEVCMVVGGGDSALEDALMLSRICSRVTILHRRATFRAGQVLQERVRENAQIDVRWNVQVHSFKAATGGRLAHVTVRDTVTGAQTDLNLDAVFVAIGHSPNTEVFARQLQTHEGTGYLSLPDRSRPTWTSVPGVFAAGDVADPVYRQAVTSAGSGAQSAIDAERWLSEQPSPKDEAASTSRMQPEDLSTHSLEDVRALLDELQLPCESCAARTDFVTALRRSWL